MVQLFNEESDEPTGCRNTDVCFGSLAALQASIRHWTMLTRPYVETLLVDEELADLVWEDWQARHRKIGGSSGNGLPAPLTGHKCDNRGFS